MFFLPQPALFNHVGPVAVNYPSDVQESLGEKRPFAQHPKRGHLITTLGAMTDRYLTTGHLLPPAGQVVLFFFSW